MESLAWPSTLTAVSYWVCCGGACMDGGRGANQSTGADSRTTTGAYIANRVTDKLTQVHDTIWCCRSGSAADTQAVADIVNDHLKYLSISTGEPPTTRQAAALFRELTYANKDVLSAGIIVAGYDPRNGGQVYSIPLGGSLHKQDYAIGGSGSTYI